jgi:hypothetical protein
MNETTIDQYRANLSTLSREMDALRASTEAARAALVKALGLKEWRALADLAAEVTDVVDALASSRAEVAALKAKLDEVDASLRAVLEQLHERPQPFVDGIVHTTGVDALGVVDRARAALTLPAFAGTEWAAPIAAASKPARDPVLPTVRAATSPLDWQDDEKGGAE